MPAQPDPDPKAVVTRIGEIDGVLRREGQEARALVLEAYGIDVDEYLEGKRVVRERISEETAAGKGETVVAYAAAFRRAREARRFSLDPTGGAARREAAAEHPAPSDDAAAAAASPAMPTYLVAPEIVASAPTYDALSGTVELRLDGQVGAPAMPFVTGPSTVFAPTIVNANTPARIERDPLNATLEVDTRNVDLDRSPLPFPPRKDADQAQSSGETWTLPQYASLCAELAAPGGLSQERKAAYHLRDEASVEAVHRTWRARFEAQPELRVEWAGLCAQYRGWLASRR